MATLVELQALRDALVKARAGGVREIRDADGSSIAYKSDGEMRAAIASLDAEIAAMTAGRPRPAVIRTITSKGI